ncbi:tRNA pseudouridine(38-40) synthase TruA [uncultured Mesonia sp.]|uniref:tRNA pseudouridine(38-40) synthase TruA n=1 Tax=uncultured Mesonia sp. TaxID=399731 RepID=UPI00374F756A
MRYFIELAYNGTAYFGWQRQPNVISVQEVLEDKLQIALQNYTPVVGAGRTDAGVHAKQLFAHFDYDETLNATEFCYKMNTLLPKDIAISQLFEVPDEAHARFDATARSYEYMIDMQKNPFTNQGSYFVKRTLDIKKMQEAADILLDYTDFESFSKVKTDVFTFDCSIMHASWKQVGHQLIFSIQANRFLRNMVRAIVGTLLEVGCGKREPKAMHQIIQSKNRSNAGASAPARGLYLTQVDYPAHIFTNHGK